VKVAAAVRESFGYEPDPAKTDDRVNSYLLLKKLHMMNPNQGPGQGGQTQLKRDGAVGTDPEVTTIRPGQQALVGGRLTFAEGSAALSPEVVAQVRQIAALIRGHRNIVLVKGHASLDDHPDTATAEERMDLSLRRAQAVADILMGQGVSPDILRVQGCSTYEPVIQRAYTASSQIVNRRVEVEATATLVSERQATSKSVSTPTMPAAAPSGGH
jgi:outer membrane protein OmpA-like peptidoglycan-associated protein